MLKKRNSFKDIFEHKGEIILKNYLALEITKPANHEKASNQQRFFKTMREGYGEGDIFIGVVVPISLKIAKMHYKKITRNMLRYAIEKFDPELREKFLKGLI